MKIVIALQIQKKEKLTPLDIEVVLKSCKKWIWTPIKWKNIPKNYSLRKVYCTTSMWARRIVFLISWKNGITFLLFYRSKNDEIWKNVTIKNKDFKKAIWKYLDIVFKDLKDWNFKQYDL